MRRLLGVLSASALLCLTSSASARAVTPTLGANHHLAGFAEVDYGHTITLSGHEPFSGVSVVFLQANPWPFISGFRTIFRSRSTGDYSFVVRPSHATRYRVVVNRQFSPTLRVFVDWNTLSDTCNICVENNVGGRNTLIIKAKFVAPPGPIAVTGPVYFYYAQNDGSRVKPTTLHLVKTAPLRIGRPFLFVNISYPVTFPVGAPFEFSYRYCWKDAEPRDGVGLPGHHHCGDATITNPSEYLG